MGNSTFDSGLKELLPHFPVALIELPLAFIPADQEDRCIVIEQVEGQLLDHHLSQHHVSQIFESTRIIGVEKGPCKRQVEHNSIEQEESLGLVILILALVLVVLVFAPGVDDFLEDRGHYNTNDRVAVGQNLVRKLTSRTFDYLRLSLLICRQGETIFKCKIGGHDSNIQSEQAPIH